MDNNQMSKAKERNDVGAEDFLMELGNLELEEIVGQKEAIKELQKFVEAIRYKSIYSEWSLKPPKGILLIGEPGVGKTAAVRALAKRLVDDVQLMELRYLDIASKWIDMPIEQLRNFFDLAEKQAKEKHVLIFIDEIDAMIPDRDNQLHETSMKRVNVFLEWMDGGFSMLENITIIGATNFLEGMDKAARRPGRFDKIIDFKELECEAIVEGLKIHLSKKKLDTNKIDPLCWDEIQLHLEGKKLTGADLPEVIARLVNKKVSEHIKRLVDMGGYNTLTHTDQKRAGISARFLPDKINTQDFVDTITEYLLTDRSGKNKKSSFGFTTSV